MTTWNSIRCARAIALCGACVLWAGAALAYTPKWLECDGQAVTTTTAGGKPQSTSAPAHDFYIYDDDGKKLFKYAEKRKAEDFVPVDTYSDKEIKWASTKSGGTFSYPQWEGQLNRVNLTLKLSYWEKDGTTTVWTQQCKAAQPQS